jgi:chromosome segregation ATPase
MGILSFLTASRLKAELTRQRDEIARLHQMLDVETTQKQDAEKLAAESTKKIAAVTAKCERQKEQQALHEKTCQEEKSALLKKWDSERKKLKTAGAQQLEEMETRLTDLRRELDEKQRQRAETTEQNAKLAEKVAQLETQLIEAASASRENETRIKELEEKNKAMETDLNKIMGNLNRW